MQSFLNDEEKRQFIEFLDLIIPANSEKAIPAAGELGIAEFVLEKSRLDSELVEMITDMLSHTQTSDDDVSPDTLRRFESKYPIGFNTLIRLTYMGYYSRADTRPLFGVSAGPVHPNGYEVPRETSELMDELTAPVRARGQIYRDV